MKKITIILGLVILQGCISVPTRQIHSFSNQADVLEPFEFPETINISVSYASNHNGGDAKKMEDHRQNILDETIIFFEEKDVSVIDVSGLDLKPVNYIDIVLITDITDGTSRIEDWGPLQGLTGVAFVFTFGLFPAISNDTDIYVIFKQYGEGELQSETRHTKSSSKLMSILFLPASPFLTHTNGISSSYRQVLEHKFLEESSK